MILKSGFVLHHLILVEKIRFLRNMINSYEALPNIEDTQKYKQAKRELAQLISRGM